MTPPSDLLADVQSIYRELAARPANRFCVGNSECCRFRITGRTPYLTKGEAAVAAIAWRAAGQKEVLPTIDGACPFLGKSGRCQIYNGRPFACRTHFCEAAGGALARGEVRDLIQRLEEIDRKLGGDGGVNLPRAVSEAMKALPTKRRRK